MEPLNQEQDNGTVDSVAGSDVNDFDMESADEVIHDQLPSVEEYKASLPSGCPSRSNTDQRSSYGNASSEDVANFDDSASYIQDQLPTVEEIKAMSGRGDNGWGVIHYFAIFVGLVALTVVIVVPTLLTQERESGGTDPPVTAPTIPPMERKQNIIQYLSDAGVSTTTQLTTSGTPQSKAVDWMTVEDELYMLVPQTSKKYTRFIERYVLAVVYFSTNGPAWKYKMNFMTGVDHCDWYDNFLSNTGIIVQHGVASCSSVPASDETEGGQMTTTLSIRKWYMF